MPTRPFREMIHVPRTCGSQSHRLPAVANSDVPKLATLTGFRPGDERYLLPEQQLCAVPRQDSPRRPDAEDREMTPAHARLLSAEEIGVQLPVEVPAEDSRDIDANAERGLTNRTAQPALCPLRRRARRTAERRYC